MKSLRGILTRSLVWATLVLSVTGGVALYFSMQTALLEQFDSALTAKAHAIGSTLRVTREGKYEMDFADESMKEFSPGKRAEYFQVTDPAGKTFERSASLDDRELVDSKTLDPSLRMWNMRLPDGRAGRAILYSVTPTSEDEDRDEHSTTRAAHATPAAMTVIVARSRGNVDEVLRALLTSIVIAATVLTCAAIIAVRYAIGMGLRPVNELANQAARIGPETLDYRFDVKSLPRELQPICERLNDLLSRLDQAFKRERRLNADIAHELRTPIAELRALTEVAQRWPADDGHAEAYFKDAHDISLRMESMVETLLALGRSQTGKAKIRVERTEIAGLLRQVVESLHEKIESKQLAVSETLDEELVIETDRVMFRRMIENLVGNAVEYCPAGGKIEVLVSWGSGRGVVRIANSNDTMKSEDVAAMFEPFWRKDAARSGDSHAGLGLTLVAEYAKRLEILVEGALRRADWFEMKLEFAAVGAEVEAPAIKA